MKKCTENNRWNTVLERTMQERKKTETTKDGQSSNKLLKSSTKQSDESSVNVSKSDSKDIDISFI